MERLDIVSFVFGSAVKSLWPQKISSRSENYSARSRLSRIQDKNSGFLFATAKVASIAAMISFLIILHLAVLLYDFHLFIT